MDESQHAELVNWMEADEAHSRLYRAARLRILLDTLKLPKAGMMHMGGLPSLHAFTELRLAYIHGLYLSTVLLALAYIERELAGSLYASGWDMAVSARLEALLTESLERGYLNKKEFVIFNRLREVRNSYAHYRALTHPMSGIQRAVSENTPIDRLLEEDAHKALHGVASYLLRRQGSSCVE